MSGFQWLLVVQILDLFLTSKHQLWIFKCLLKLFGGSLLLHKLLLLCLLHLNLNHFLEHFVVFIEFDHFPVALGYFQKAVDVHVRQLFVILLVMARSCLEKVVVSVHLLPFSLDGCRGEWVHIWVFEDLQFLILRNYCSQRHSLDYRLLLLF